MNVPENELFSAYVDGELTADEQTQVENLLSTSPAAQQVVDEFRSLSAGLQALPQQRLKVDLTDRILRQAAREILTDSPGRVADTLPRPLEDDEGAAFRRFFSPRALAWSAIAVAVAIMLLLSEGPELGEPNLDQVAVAPQADRLPNAAIRAAGEEDIQAVGEVDAPTEVEVVEPLEPEEPVEDMAVALDVPVEVSVEPIAAMAETHVAPSDEPAGPSVVASPPPIPAASSVAMDNEGLGPEVRPEARVVPGVARMDSASQPGASSAHSGAAVSARQAPPVADVAVGGKPTMRSVKPYSASRLPSGTMPMSVAVPEMLDRPPPAAASSGSKAQTPIMTVRCTIGSKAAGNEIFKGILDEQKVDTFTRSETPRMPVLFDVDATAPQILAVVMDMKSRPSDFLTVACQASQTAGAKATGSQPSSTQKATVGGGRVTIRMAPTARGAGIGSADTVGISPADGASIGQQIAVRAMQPAAGLSEVGTGRNDTGAQNALQSEAKHRVRFIFVVTEPAKSDSGQSPAGKDGQAPDSQPKPADAKPVVADE